MPIHANRVDDDRWCQPASAEDLRISSVKESGQVVGATLIFAQLSAVVI